MGGTERSRGLIQLCVKLVTASTEQNQAIKVDSILLLILSLQLVRMSRRNRLPPEEALSLFDDVSDSGSDGGNISDLEIACDSSDDEEYVADAEVVEESESDSEEMEADDALDESEDSLEAAAPPPPKRRRGAGPARVVSASASAFIAKDGTKWEKEAPQQGRAAAANVVHQAQGIPRHARNLTDAMEAFFLFLDRTMVQLIVKCTNEEAKLQKGEQYDLNLDEDEFMAFIGLVIARGVFCARNEPVDALWSDKYGRSIFKSTMARDRFLDILRYLRFDKKSDRRERRQNDKFCLVREIWDRFVANCRESYHPSPYLTVDEQLFATKVRCPFTQYMPQKPGKFGIKFWVLADASCPYILNIRPYLGKHFDEDRQGLQLGEFVVMKLIEPYLGKGYNVTTDNFFTSLRLATKLYSKKNNSRGNCARQPTRAGTRLHQQASSCQLRIPRV